jgi:TolA-binding protein
VSDKMKLADRLAVFLTERRALVIAALVVVVIIIVAAAVWGPVRSGIEDKSAQIAEDIDQSFSDWLYAGDDEKTAKEEEFLAKAQSGLDGKDYSVQRALFMRGQYYINLEKWAEASADFASLAERFPKSYLAPVALFNAASTSESAGDKVKAVELYTRLVDDYADKAGEAAEALFNLGRLAEEGGDQDRAKEFYNRLIADYDTSDWKNIAKTRILLMN